MRLKLHFHKVNNTSKNSQSEAAGKKRLGGKNVERRVIESNKVKALFDSRAPTFANKSTVTMDTW